MTSSSTASAGLLAAATEIPPMLLLLGLMLVAGVLLSLLLVRFRQSLLAAYFICGALLANSGLLTNLGGPQLRGRVDQMAEFGVVLLMFTLGLEFSLKELKHLRRFVFVGGFLQMLACGLPALAVALLCKVPWQQSLVLAVGLALSSTAVSLRMISEANLGASQGGRFSVGVAIFQDLFVIAFFILLPVFLTDAAQGGEIGNILLLVSGQGILFVLIAWLLAKFVIPRLLHAVADTRSGELFTLTVVGLCVGLALLGGLMQLSLALGAFVAGVAVSDSIYKHRILSDILPLKHLFLALFFVSAGLVVDMGVAQKYWMLIVGITGAILLGKFLLVSLVGRRLGLSLQDAFFAAAVLSSAGEFSLVLLQQAQKLRPWPEEIGRVLPICIALSMGLVPLMAKLVPHAVRLGRRLGWQKKPALPEMAAATTARTKSLHSHAIVIGYGPVGKKLVETLNRAGVPTLIIELNPKTVRELHKQGQPVLFADAAHLETWELARVREARLAAFTFADATAAAQALSVLRDICPELPVIARSRFAADIDRLQRLGADVVIMDESEAAKAFERETLTLCSSG